MPVTAPRGGYTGYLARSDSHFDSLCLIEGMADAARECRLSEGRA